MLNFKHTMVDTKYVIESEQIIYIMCHAQIPLITRASSRAKEFSVLLSYKQMQEEIFQPLGKASGCSPPTSLKGSIAFLPYRFLQTLNTSINPCTQKATFPASVSPSLKSPDFILGGPSHPSYSSIFCRI